MNSSPPDPEEAQTTLINPQKYKPYPVPSSPLRFSSPLNVLATTLLILTLILLIPLTYLITTQSQSQPYNQCGTTAAEARSRNCVFETTGFTWLPSACADPTTEAEFLAYIEKERLELYRDVNYTDVVPIEEVRRGEGKGFFVTQAYHITHCLFLLKKLHRAVNEGRLLDGQIMPAHHTEHCVEMALKGPGFKEGVVQLSYTKFPYCGRVGGFDVLWRDGVGPLGWTTE
ncbi:unnamed protein product [Periconia digitata]|uniref:Uncharacterized protein n=1 Tax=Periconia digitata TaxID=1303443 RepID=A0A9W4ULU4_9PLEO|nr:unnamed protein product [Periconia digitata]